MNSYLDRKEKIDSHFRGNDRSGGDNEDERYKGSNEIARFLFIQNTILVWLQIVIMPQKCHLP